MMNWWLDKGVDGFRMDVLSLLSKEPGLPDLGPVLNGYAVYNACANGPRVHEYIQEMRRKVLNRADTITVGECCAVTLEEAKKYASRDGREVNMVFQFEHMDVDSDGENKWTDKKMDLRKMKEVLTRWEKGLEGIAWNSLFWDNHDLPRIVSRWGNDKEYRVESAKMLAILLHGMQGTPYIFEGEELGMTNVHYNIEDYRDVEIQNVYKERIAAGYDKEDVMNSIYAKGRDNARTPMQWDDTENAGFTTGTPWIKVNDNYKTINAKSQIDDPDSIFNCYRKLVSFRKEYPVLVDGSFKLLLAEDENIFAYERKNADETLLVVCNFYGNTVKMPLTEETEDMELLISNYKETEDSSVLRPYEARMYYKK